MIIIFSLSAAVRFWAMFRSSLEIIWVVAFWALLNALFHSLDNFHCELSGSAWLGFSVIRCFIKVSYSPKLIKLFHPELYDTLGRWFVQGKNDWNSPCSATKYPVIQFFLHRKCYVWCPIDFCHKLLPLGWIYLPHPFPHVIPLRPLSHA